MHPSIVKKSQDDVYSQQIRRLVRHRNGFGVLRPMLFDHSSRWQWWSLALLEKKLPLAPYPKIKFEDHLENDKVFEKILDSCLNKHGYEFDDFLTWLLFCFGDPLSKDIKHIPNNAIEFWKNTFNPKLFLDHPGDWLGHYYETNLISPSASRKTGFFSTPPALCKLMVEISLKDSKLCDSFNEPCIGSGRILMEASNYVLNLTGNDINPILVKIAKINTWFYIPSAALPCKELLWEA